MKVTRLDQGGVLVIQCSDQALITFTSAKSYDSLGTTENTVPCVKRSTHDVKGVKGLTPGVTLRCDMIVLCVDMIVLYVDTDVLRRDMIVF